jgi:hypothetical protein
MWTNEALEEAMDVIKRGTHSIRRVSKSWNIPMNSFVDHLNGRTRSGNMGLKDAIVITLDISNARMWTIH